MKTSKLKNKSIQYSSLIALILTSTACDQGCGMKLTKTGEENSNNQNTENSGVNNIGQNPSQQPIQPIQPSSNNVNQPIQENNNNINNANNTILHEQRLKLLYPEEHIKRRNLTADQFKELASKGDLAKVIKELNKFKSLKELLDKLINKEIDVDEKYNGEHPIIAFLREDSKEQYRYCAEEIIALFINLGADLKNVEDKDGTGLIHFIIKYYSYDNAQTIFYNIFKIYRGVFDQYFDINKRDKNGDTAVLEFFENSSGKDGFTPTIVSYFLSFNTNFSLKYEKDRTIFDTLNFWEFMNAGIADQFSSKVLNIDSLIRKIDYSIFDKDGIENLINKIVEKAPKNNDNEIIKDRCEVVYSSFMASRKRLGKMYDYKDTSFEEEEEYFADFVKKAIASRKV